MTVRPSKALFFLSLFITVLLNGAVILSQDEVTLQSIESKTQKGHPVFNKVKFATNGKLDIWTMKQSHSGYNHPLKQWDTIRIIVDREKKIVRYQQLHNDREVELKAACYTCHSNGPRAIRPDYNSKVVSYSFRDKLTVAVMNFKIKSYGRLRIDSKSFMLNGNFRSVPLMFFGKTDQTVLNVKTCTLCHNRNQFWGRGELVRQHGGTIRHLVNTGQMPPWPFTLSQDDKIKIEKFIKNH